MASTSPSFKRLDRVIIALQSAYSVSEEEVTQSHTHINDKTKQKNPPGQHLLFTVHRVNTGRFPAAGCGGAARPRSATPTSYEFDKQPCGFTLLLPVKQKNTHTHTHTFQLKSITIC